MARRISDVLGVTRKDLTNQGAFNGFVDIDAKFHVDPHLLEDTKIPEFTESYTKLKEYFSKIIHLLDSSQSKNDRFSYHALNMLTFPETNNMKLGYATGGSGGKGIGSGLAKEIASTAFEIVKAGIKDPVIFELVGLFEENVGADRISDMTIHVIFQDILSFSQRVAKNLKLHTRKYTYENNVYEIPVDKSSLRYIPLIPFEILRNLPIALDWDDIDIVCSYNRQLRARVNEMIGNTWKEAQKKKSKRELKDAILQYPELINELITLYKSKKDKHYDFVQDPSGEIIWADIADDFAKKYPLKLVSKPGTIPPLNNIVTDICTHYKRLVENNGLNAFFYDNLKQLRHEKFAQLLFYGIADAYCQANNLDISREPNAGRGSVDFKFSRGYFEKVNVEVKYAKNSGLVRGYTTQLPTYNKAENTVHSIYLVIQTTYSEYTIQKIQQIHDENKKQGKRVPAIITIDGRTKPSASKSR